MADFQLTCGDSNITKMATDAISCNMFAYCGNNPVRRTDPTGASWFEDFWEDVVDWCSDTFGAATYVSNKYDSMSLDTLFGGYETGIDTSSLVGGDNEKPIVFYVQRASNWWKFNEYACGVSINSGSDGFAIGISITDVTVGVCTDDTSLDIIIGANKIGYTAKSGVDYGKHSAGSYAHFYIRTWTVAAVCYAAYATGGAAAGAFLLTIS